MVSIILVWLHVQLLVTVWYSLQTKRTFSFLTAIHEAWQSLKCFSCWVSLSSKCPYKR